MTVLLVDHDAAANLVLADMLDKKGYACLRASDAEKALSLAKHHEIRVVVYIRQASDTSGLDLCSSIRRLKKGHYIYFIMGTPKDNKPEKIQGFAQGVDAFVTTPVDHEKLTALVQVGMRISGFSMPKPLKKERPKKPDVSTYDIPFARIALEKNFVTKEQLAKAFSSQKKAQLAGGKNADQKTGDTRLSKKTAEILVAQGAITEAQRDMIRREMEKDRGIVSETSQQADDAVQSPEQADISDQSPFQVQISSDRMEARLVVNNAFFDRITPDAIAQVLEKADIQFGVADLERQITTLKTTLKESVSFIAAKGRPPVPGTDAFISYHFDTDYLKPGKIDTEGKMDYTERGSIPTVAAGDLLATKIAMKTGTPGIDIYNTPISAPETKDVVLQCGQGAYLSDDGIKAYARIDGQPHVAVDGVLCVFAELTIDGDVNFTTGNIDFDGNVIVKGTVMNGFTVRCGHLFAKEISGAAIFALGNVIVSEGIISADIKTEGDVKARFITGSNIKSFGSVMVDKEVIDTKIRSSAKFLSERCAIISSFVSAKMGVSARQIGTDVSSACRIHAGMDENVKKRIQAFDHAMNDKKKVLETVQKRYEKQSKKQRGIHRKIFELAQSQERLASESGAANALARELDLYFRDQEILEEQIAQDLAAIEAVIAEIETMGKEKTALLQWSKEEQGDPVITVSGAVTQGTKLFGIYTSYIPTETMRNVTIRETKHPETDDWQMVMG
ncbi:MAG TPA: flagellar assembly protein A [Desulfotignum sp.]|nr:flagellar assembly protein A [Desulfotignum sp.]